MSNKAKKFISNFPKDFIITFLFITAFNAYYHTSFDFVMNLILNATIFLICGCCVASIRIDKQPLKYELYTYLIAIISAAGANYFYVPISEINKSTFVLISIVAAIPISAGVFSILSHYYSRKIDKSTFCKRQKNAFGIVLFAATLICIGTFIAVTR